MGWNWLTLMSGHFSLLAPLPWPCPCLSLHPKTPLLHVPALSHCPALSVGGPGRVGVKMGTWGSVYSRLSQMPPLWSSPQNARLSIARPASATTSVPSVRRACTCTRAAATQTVPRALQLPMAPQNAAVLVRHHGRCDQRVQGPRRRAARECGLGAVQRKLTAPSPATTTLWGFSQDFSALGA